MKRIEHTEDGDRLSLQVCDLFLLRIMHVHVSALLYSVINYYYMQFKKAYSEKKNVDILFTYVVIPKENERLLTVLNKALELSNKDKSKYTNVLDDSKQEEIKQRKLNGILYEETYASLSREQQLEYWVEYQNLLKDCYNHVYSGITDLNYSSLNNVSVEIPLHIQEKKSFGFNGLEEIFRKGIEEVQPTVELESPKSRRLAKIIDGFSLYFNDHMLPEEDIVTEIPPMLQPFTVNIIENNKDRQGEIAREIIAQMARKPYIYTKYNSHRDNKRVS